MTDTLQGSVNEVFFIDITIVNDDIVEIPNSEDFIVRIASSSPLVVGDRISIAPEETRITIIDDDGEKSTVWGVIFWSQCVRESS